MPASWRSKAPTSSMSGAESTRPYGGAKPVSADDELARLTPVLPAVVELGLPVSIDTVKAPVAAWALDQGAAIVNDVWGLQRDPDMAPLVAERGVPDRRDAQPRTRPRPASTSSPTSPPSSPARSTSPRAPASRASRSCSTPASASARRRSKASLAWRGLSEFKRFGLPLLVGASRKRFINSVIALAAGRPHRRLDRRASSGGRQRRGDRARARCGRDRAGAARRRRDRGARDERPHLHQGLGAARLSRRDAL